jgi:hypothetical protein
VAALLFLLSSEPSVNPFQAPAIAQYICKYSERYRVYPLYPLAIQKIETGFQHSRKPSRTQDYGIAQIHCPRRTYAPWCRNKKRLLTLQGNIQIQVYFLSLAKKSCLRGHRHRKNTHWTRHYNWYARRRYDREVLKVIEKFRRKLSNAERNPTCLR